MPAETVKVVVRVRPMNSKEKSENCLSCVDVDDKGNAITLKKASDNDQKTFTFDYVFGVEAQQQFIYENTAFPLVESVVEGYNGTICAYGQTGCGKTFTMIGEPTNDRMKGIIPRTFEHIINMINTAEQNNKKFLVRCSYIEIYNEEIHDLLSKDVKARMDIKESVDRGVFIKDLQINVVRSIADMDRYMSIGTGNRAVGATAMNEGSSRSHCIFTVYIECSVSDVKGNQRITAGKLNLVDLAGSERQDKTKATGDRLKEATKINLSLSALGNVISALVEGKSQHIPYRDSKLTRLLQDSLGGNTKTIIIAAVSPADNSYDETSSTLRYASRAKLIKNQPKVNEDPKDAQLKEYAMEIQKLREMLARQQANPQAIVAQQQQPVAQQPGAQQPAAQQGQTVAQQQAQQVSQSQVLAMQKKLQNVNQDLQKQREQYESDLKAQEEMVRREREDRERLEALIQEKEKMFMNGGQANEEEKKKYKTMQSKIKQQKREREKLIEEGQKQQEELLKMEKNYNSLNEEVEQLRKLVTFLRKKYQESLTEIKDLEKENETNKSDLLDNIRIQDKELKLLTGIMKMLLSSDEIEVLRTACEWREDANEFMIPPFTFKQKKLNFPTLARGQAMDLINEEKAGRELAFPSNENDSAAENQMRGTMNQFRVRNHNNYSSPQVPKKQNERGPQMLGQAMAVNSALRGSNYSVQVPAPEQLEKRATKVMLQPLMQEAVQFPLSPRDATMSHSQLPANSVFIEQTTVPGSLQKPNKANLILQPMDRPPLPHPREVIPNDSSDFKRPGRNVKLDKLG